MTEKILKSIQNNNIILPKQENDFVYNNIFEYLWSLRHDLPMDKSSNLSILNYIKDINAKIPDLEKAVLLAIEMILNNKTIGIIGDYDVDGTVSTTVIVKFFKHLKQFVDFEYIYHIPNRFTEGYGPSQMAINSFKDKNVSLLITVDSGSTSIKEITLANSMNIKSIILDHHLVQEETPEATCFVNCNNSEEFKYLCGSGIAFVFCIQLQKFIKNVFEEKNITFVPFDFNEVVDLVAIATVCDFVPLVNLNRSIVSLGLKRLNFQYYRRDNNTNPAIHMILQYAMFNYNKHTYISSQDLGFLIGPYINVPGRLTDGNIIVKFLCCTDKENLQIYFLTLQKLWRERKKIQENILSELNIDLSKCYILVYEYNIHEGVMGIISAKLKDKYYKPSIVIAVDSQTHIGKGSIRSIKPFNAGYVIETALKKDILLKGGGHMAAGGFSLHISKIDLFKQHIDEYVKDLHIPPVKDLQIDCIMGMHGLDKIFFDQVQTLGPFGVCNEEFLYFFPNLQIKNFHIISQKHISFIFSNISETHTIKGMWFFAPLLNMEYLQVNNIINVIANIKYINKRIELLIVDVHIDKDENEDLLINN